MPSQCLAFRLADLDATGGVVRSYVFGPGIDNLLAMTVTTGGTARAYFYITDRLGSVQALTDESGNIVEQYRYDAWGRVLGVYDGAGRSLMPLPWATATSGKGGNTPGRPGSTTSGRAGMTRLPDAGSPMTPSG